MPLRPGNTGIDQRHFHIFQKVQLGQKVVLLEDEPQLFVADGGQLVAGHLPYIPAVQPVGPIGGHIQAADDVHAGGFARAGLPHDGHKLAPVDPHGDVIRCFYRGITHLIVFAYPVKLDQCAHGSALRCGHCDGGAAIVTGIGQGGGVVSDHIAVGQPAEDLNVLVIADTGTDRNIRQPMMFMQVDLPEPDCPTMATNSPRSIRMEM